MGVYCSVCGAETAVGWTYCPKCGTRLDGALETVARADGRPAAETLPTTLTPAAPSTRLAAAAVDLAIVEALVYTLYFVLLRQLGLLRARRILPIVLVVWLAAPLYAVFKDAIGGKSLGKFLLGVTVVNQARQRLGRFQDSLYRNAVFGVIVVPIVGPVLHILLSAVVAIQIASGRSQRLGDRMASTLVVDDTRSRLNQGL